MVCVIVALLWEVILMRTKTNIPISYYGMLAEICEKYVAEKQTLGYDYKEASKRLSKFTKFSMAYNFPANTLPKEMVLDFVKRNPNEEYRNCEIRCTVVRDLAKYMIRNGYDAYLLPVEYLGKRPSRYIPYIFTHDEIQLFFKVIDGLTYKKHSSSPRRHLVLPVLFRFLYCCGLRISEVLNLLGNDVDLNEGILLIRESKFEKTRYVPLSDELLSICIKYDKTRLRSCNPEDDWFFAAPNGGRYSERSIYSAFRDFLSDANISHKGRGKGPRLHDLRHTFAVHCLQKAIETGAEPTTVLPRLSTYMGHSSFKATEYYLKMTAEIYPQIIEQLEKELGYIVLEVGGEQ